MKAIHYNSNNNLQLDVQEKRSQRDYNTRLHLFCQVQIITTQSPQSYENLVLEFNTRELDKVLSTMYLPLYILTTNGLCLSFLAYSK